jgi:hypothetical protein
MNATSQSPNNQEPIRSEGLDPQAAPSAPKGNGANPDGNVVYVQFPGYEVKGRRRRRRRSSGAAPITTASWTTCRNWSISTGY